eukprot:6201129-Pleurochrysis_carterae.AAC.2
MTVWTCVRDCSRAFKGISDHADQNRALKIKTEQEATIVNISQYMLVVKCEWKSSVAIKRQRGGIYQDFRKLALVKLRISHTKRNTCVAWSLRSTKLERSKCPGFQTIESGKLKSIDTKAKTGSNLKQDNE